VNVFDQAKARSDCREVVLGLTTLNKSNQGPCPLCGGSDRFYLHTGGDRCGCRVCGFQGDQIDLLAKVQGVSRVQAAEHLAGAKSLPKTVRVHAPQKKAPPKIVREWVSESWQSEARTIIEAGESRIQLEGYHGQLHFQDGQYLWLNGQYLWQSRRINLRTAQAFRLGYDPEVFDPATKSKRPAIIIPWLDRSGTITAIKYRFIDELAAQDKGRRFSQKKGSESLLFGLNACSKDSKPRGVVIVEGEFNAMAIAQAVGDSVDVLSVGSQGNSRGLEFALQHCEKYPGVNVMLWFDEEKQVKEAFKVFPKGIGVKSLDGLDANDILKTYGILGLGQYVNSRFPKSVCNIDRPEPPKKPKIARVYEEEVFI
jgi:hypothetical protein